MPPRNLLKEGPFVAFTFFWGGSVPCAVWMGAQLLAMHRSSVHQAIHDFFARTWVAAREENASLDFS